jgi:hypothetical protein
MNESETQPQLSSPKRSSLTESENGEDVLTKALLFKQGRGRSLSFLKPWRERLVVVDHKKMTLSYYQISDGSEQSLIYLLTNCLRRFDWLNSPPPEESIKGTIPLEEAIIADLPDSGRQYAFAVLNGDVHVNLSCPTQTQKSQVFSLSPAPLHCFSCPPVPSLLLQWMSLLQAISQSGRSEANKEKFQRLHQMGPSASSPGKLLKQNSRLLNRTLTPKQTPVALETNKDYHSDDDNESTATAPTAQKEPLPQPQPQEERSPSPTPPILPPRPVSRQPTTSPPLESIDPDEIFQQAGQLLLPLSLVEFL